MEIRALVSAMWRNRTGPILVAAQVAITLAVVVNMAYLIQQRLETAAKPTGIDINNIFWVHLEAIDPEYNYEAAVRADLDYLNALPGVIAAATSNGTPQAFYALGLPFAVSPEQLDKEGAHVARVFMANEHYLDALGLELIAGRNFESSVVAPPAQDVPSGIAAWAPEVIITKYMADKLFPDGNAVGKPLYVGLVNRSSTVVGVVKLLQGAPMPDEQFALSNVLVPMIPPGPDSFYIVRTEPGRRDATMARVEKELADRVPGRFLSRIEALEKTAAQARFTFRSSAIILSVIGVFVLAVTLVGITGLAAFNVTTRTRQLGTRRAIGARKFHILRYFIVENWIITSVGALVGCALALAAGIKLSTTYALPRLPLYFLVAGVVAIWILGLLAVVVPARRAASISPATATRTV
ncbi:MAG: ABC transporter permease [Steroidobacteraceae bacterium]|nr:ABC transporter permease [Steroidobacteraceae bacterium]